MKLKELTLRDADGVMIGIMTSNIEDGIKLPEKYINVKVNNKEACIDNLIINLDKTDYEFLVYITDIMIKQFREYDKNNLH